MSKILLALGGNALGNSPSEQIKAVKKTASAVVRLVGDGHSVIIVHGNGPQVGMINNAFMSSYESGEIGESMPFPECGALSQGYIGYHLQNAINNELINKKIDKNVITLITQTIVDSNDEAFKNPTKPIGSFMDEATATKLADQNNWVVKEDSGRGWRRVVPSPKPIDIIEKASISNLLDTGSIIIAGGGGGVPTIKKDGAMIGVPAVIDKDHTASKIAEIIGADVFIVLTAVDRVMINFGKDNQEELVTMNEEEAIRHIGNNQFAPGSMLPKVMAALSFAKSTNKPAYIGDLKNALEILKEKSGTKIVAK